MNKIIASAFAVLLAATPIAAMTATSAAAAETVSARVVNYSDDSNLLFLSNGKLYILPANFDRTALYDGADVTVSWNQSGVSRVVQGVSAQ